MTGSGVVLSLLWITLVAAGNTGRHDVLSTERPSAQPDQASFTEGQLAVITCQTNVDVSNLTFIWFVDGELLADETGQQLKFNATKEDNGARILCRTRDSKGLLSAVSNPALVSVVAHTGKPFSGARIHFGRRGTDVAGHRRGYPRYGSARQMKGSLGSVHKGGAAIKVVSVANAVAGEKIGSRRVGSRRGGTAVRVVSARAGDGSFVVSAGALADARLVPGRRGSVVSSGVGAVSVRGRGRVQSVSAGARSSVQVVSRRLGPGRSVAVIQSVVRSVVRVVSVRPSPRTTPRPTTPVPTTAPQTTLPPVDGNWGEWSECSPCSVTCGTGNCIRRRRCDSPVPANGGSTCPGQDTDTVSCSREPTPANGEWSPWVAVGQCSVTCGSGVQQRVRTCTNPVPLCGGASCPGNNIDTFACTSSPCPVDGSWGPWSLCGECSVTCGTGTCVRSRQCDSPAPAFGGAYCTGAGVETEQCSRQPARASGGWSEWQNDGPCSTTCGEGVQPRIRTCTNPAPKCGGADCGGNSRSTVACNVQECPVDGNWGPWGTCGSCSVSCGTGLCSRTRQCNNPVPTNGGRPCDGPSELTEKCSNGPHIVNGSWSEWQTVGACSATCGEGQQRRGRTCSDPSAQCEGATCPGISENTVPCNVQPCPVNGGWTEWSTCGDCSVSCGVGTCFRTRQCNRPVPSNGGSYCVGAATLSESCSVATQRVDGGWSEWQNEGPCSRTCGEGVQPRVRTCTRPAPQCGGNGCGSNSRGSISCNVQPCSVNGGWGLWSSWGECSASCGVGTSVRRRRCNSPPPANGGRGCDGTSVESRTCSVAPLPINGGWSEWNNQGACSVTCGEGVQPRVRSCTRPVPQCGGNRCGGDTQSSVPCNPRPCPVDGDWSQWSNWGDCSVSCGTGAAVRRRRCDSPNPAYEGEDCDGEEEETRECTHDPTPQDGGWSEWQNSGPCSKTCGGGIQQKVRTCTRPVPQCGGASCGSNNRTSVPCNEQPCPVNGNWGQWSSWGDCSVSCGNGVSIRTRLCNNPAPANCGKDCDGSNLDTQQCNRDPLPTNGGWVEWQNSGVCSRTCGEGSQLRVRTCTNPAPQCGGTSCPGTNETAVRCNNGPCPVNGGWSEWSSCSECSVTCGSGLCIRTRQCNRPAPAFGGQYCLGFSVGTEPCTAALRSVNGGWSEWENSGECSTTCDEGVQRRVRTCSKPAPLCGGLSCPGSNETTVPCSNGPCPVDGGWSGWSDCSECSVTCGVGTCVRRRVCNNPAPAFGGSLCSGSGEQTETCSNPPQPVNGSWSSWQNVGKCSVTCGSNGVQQRARTCTNPAPQCGGIACPGSSTSVVDCSRGPCPVNGNWGDWSDCGACSVTCGTGRCSRRRRCDSPAPANGGSYCTGPSDVSESCTTLPLPVNGGWTEWVATGQCSASCGAGVQQRLRTCSSPAPQCGGLPCPGSSTSTVICSVVACPVNGSWSEWGTCSVCSATCGLGVCVRSRQCNNPAPANGGASCQGDYQRTESCSGGVAAVNGGWSSWRNEDQCSATCGDGFQRRVRSCTNPSPLCGGLSCSGSNQSTVTCNYGPCPVDGNWGPWGECSACSVSCGRGTCFRRRLCDSPATANGGRPCLGSDQLSELCSVNPLPADGTLGAWGPWSLCSASCNGGTWTRSRVCDLPVCGGRGCSGETAETAACNTEACEPASAPQTTAPPESCLGRCTLVLLKGSFCKCDPWCVKRKDCCTDYHATCASCQGRCAETRPDPLKSCQCDPLCNQNYRGDCCKDIKTYCKKFDEHGSWNSWSSWQA